MTSPPYWALRDYGRETLTVWDGDPDCKHKWGKRLPSHHPGQVEQTKWKKATAAGKGQTAVSGRYCLKCGAWKGQLGLEPDFGSYIRHLCAAFDQVRRVLRKTGTCWVNMGDTYGGSGNASGHTAETKNLEYKTSEMGATRGITIGLMPKSLIMIPFRFAIEMANRGWILRNTIIWHKPNCMPSSAKDRFTVDFEYLFFFTKSRKYWFEQQFERLKRGHWDAMPEIGGKKHTQGNSRSVYSGNTPPSNPCGRNKRCVWNIPTRSFPQAHFAVYPEALCETPIRAGCPPEGIVLDPFMGTGTTLLVATKLNRKSIGIEPSRKYIKMAIARLEQETSFEGKDNDNA